MKSERLDYIIIIMNVLLLVGDLFLKCSKYPRTKCKYILYCTNPKNVIKPSLRHLRNHLMSKPHLNVQWTIKTPI